MGTERFEPGMSRYPTEHLTDYEKWWKSEGYREFKGKTPSEIAELGWNAKAKHDTDAMDNIGAQIEDLATSLNNIAAQGQQP